VDVVGAVVVVAPDVVWLPVESVSGRVVSGGGEEEVLVIA
jgi:hypothetical protein